MKVISIRKNPEYTDRAIHYFQNRWPSVWPIIYEDCLRNCLTAKLPLPQWYLLELDDKIIGGAGLITNDFISRGDLYPWLCALFIDEAHRGNNYAQLLVKKAKDDTKSFGFDSMYLSTSHIGYYEKYGFKYIGPGYHPWEEESRIYEIEL